MSAAAEKLKVNKSTICRFVAKHDKLRVLIDEITDDINDLAETGLVLALRKGEPWAIKYWLDNRGQARGYGMRKLAFRDENEVLRAPPGVLIADASMTREQWAARDWRQEGEDAIAAAADAKPPANATIN